MSKNSKIEWTTHTFTPWTGCTKISEGCKWCYAESWAKRSGHVEWGPQAERRRTSPATWHEPVKWDREAAATGKRVKVFCASLSDVFEDHPSIDPQWRADLWALIDATPNLDWLLLTKRPENIRRLWPFGFYDEFFSWPNIWLGTTVENQEQANSRIPNLLAVPAAVRFLSCEPLLGPVDLGHLLDGLPSNYWITWLDRLDWVIAGGESGVTKARPMHPSWVRSLRDQCEATGTAFLFKQWGAWRPNAMGKYCVFPDGRTAPNLEPQGSNGEGSVRVSYYLGKQAGRELDGHIYDDYPGNR